MSKFESIYESQSEKYSKHSGYTGAELRRKQKVLMTSFAEYWFDMNKREETIGWPWETIEEVVQVLFDGSNHRRDLKPIEFTLFKNYVHWLEIECYG